MFYIIYEEVLNIIINSPINKGGTLLGPFDPLGRGQVDLWRKIKDYFFLTPHLTWNF